MDKVNCNNSIPERIAALRQLMKDEGIDACVVPTGDPHMSEYISDHYETRRFITGFTGSAGTAVITADEAGLWADSRYYLQAAEELKGSGITLHKDGLPETVKLPDYLVQKLGKGDTISFDGRLVGSKWTEELKKTPGFDMNLRTDIDLVGEIWEDRPALTFNSVVDYPVKYAGVSRCEKFAQIREDMKKSGADILIVSALSDNAWLLNLRGDDVLCNPVFFSYVIMTQDRALLFAKKEAFAPELIDELAKDGIELLPYESFYGQLAGVGELAGGDEVAVMVDSETCSQLIADSMPWDIRVIKADSPVMLRKAVKNPVEREGIYSAQEKDGAALCKFVYWLKKSVATSEITELSAAEKLHNLRAEQDLFMGDSFEAIIGYGPHASIVHYSATPETDAHLQPCGMVLVDSGGQYLDGTTDTTRTIVLGPLTDREKILFTAVLRGHIALAKTQFVKGLNGANVDHLAHIPLWELGLDYRHSTGHGVGHYLNVHEDPVRIFWNEAVVSPKIPVFEEGMLFSDEPGYYEDDAFGIRHESLLLCLEGEKTEYGQFMKFDAVTMVPFDLEGIIPEQMKQDEKDWLNQYHEKVYEKIAPHITDEEREWLREATRAI